MAYEFKVAWCPLCNQGWVEIVKDAETHGLFVCCSECEAEWAGPAAIDVTTVRPSGRSRAEEPTREEVEAVGWDAYVLRP